MLSKSQIITLITEGGGGLERLKSDTVIFVRSLYTAHRSVKFICHEWASALGGRDFIWSKFSKLALREKSTVS